MSRDYQVRQGINMCYDSFVEVFFDKKLVPIINDIQRKTDNDYDAGTYPNNISRTFWLSYNEETEQMRCLALLKNNNFAYLYYSKKQNKGIGLFIHPTKQYLIDNVMGDDCYRIYLEETTIV